MRTNLWYVQLYLEIRTILGFLLDQMRSSAEPVDRHKFVPDVIPSFLQVHVSLFHLLLHVLTCFAIQNLVHATSRSRKLHDRQSLVQGQSVLADKGRWLTQEVVHSDEVRANLTCIARTPWYSARACRSSCNICWTDTAMPSYPLQRKMRSSSRTTYFFTSLLAISFPSRECSASLR